MGIPQGDQIGVGLTQGPQGSGWGRVELWAQLRDEWRCRHERPQVGGIFAHHDAVVLEGQPRVQPPELSKGVEIFGLEPYRPLTDIRRHRSFIVTGSLRRALSNWAAG